MMQFSFVIPARDEFQTFDLTISNIFRTSGEHQIEIILVDDASRPPLAPENSSKVKLLRNDVRRGVAKSRNLGAREACGEFLVFLDAHVCFLPGWLDQVLEQRHLLKKGLLGAAVGSIYDFNQFVSMVRCEKMPNPAPENFFYGLVFETLPRPGSKENPCRKSNSPFHVPGLSTQCLIVDRILFSDLGEFEDELTGFGGLEDIDLSLRAWVLGYEVMVDPNLLSFHYCEPSKLAQSKKVDYDKRPFYVERYEDTVENTLRIMYLLLTDQTFDKVMAHYSAHPNFNVDLNKILTDKLRERKARINARRKKSESWLLERMAYI